MTNIKGTIPADVTVDIGSFSRAARKDMRNGTREIWLIVVRALFDVSLPSHRSVDIRESEGRMGNVRKTPENCDHVVRELVDELLRIFRCVLWRFKILRKRA